MSRVNESQISIIRSVAKKNKLKNISIQELKEKFTGDNFLGGINRVILKGEVNGRKKVYHLFYKSCPQSKELARYLAMTKFYETETFCYESILPVLNNIQTITGIPKQQRFLYPKFYKACLTNENRAIVLADLSVKGYIMCDRRDALDFDHIAVVINNLASFHAAGFVLKENDNNLFSKLTSKIGKEHNYGRRFMGFQKATIRVASEFINNPEVKSIIEERLLKNLDEIFENYLKAENVHPFGVICHGDLWINNILFKYKGGEIHEAVFLDWQLCRLASPVTDIAHFICLSTDKDFRDENLTAIFDIYYDALGKRIKMMGHDVNKCYPRSVFEKHVEDYFQWGLAIGMVTLHVFLANSGEIKSLEEVIRDFESGNYSIHLNSVALKRLNDLADDFVRRALI